MQYYQFWIHTINTLRGPWHVSAYGNYWYIVNIETGEHKRIGRVGGPRGNGRGTNYHDRAIEEAKRRNGGGINHAKTFRYLHSAFHCHISLSRIV